MNQRKNPTSSVKRRLFESNTPTFQAMRGSQGFRPSAPKPWTASGRVESRRIGARRDESRTPPAPPAPSILIVESDDELALALEQLLEDFKFNVECVASVEQAKLALDGCQFDLVVFACGDDPASCAELISCLRGASGGERTPAVVAARREQDEAALTAGVGSVETCRPLSTIVDAVRTALDLRSNRRF